MLISRTRLAALTISLGTAYLAVMLVLTYLIDFLGINLFGVKDWLNRIGYEEPVLFWLHFFSEGSITEILQWLCLAVAFLVLTLFTRQKHRVNPRPPWIWIIFSIAILLMFLEDSINLRHELSDIIGNLLAVNTNTIEWRRSFTRSLVEIAFYALLGFMMITPFFFILRGRAYELRGKIYLSAGYCIYAIASIGSVTRNWNDWYARAGTRLIEFIAGSQELEWSGESMIYFSDPLGFWFMDFVVEESLELLGASLLLAAIIILTAGNKTKLDSGKHH